MPARRNTIRRSRRQTTKRGRRVTQRSPPDNPIYMTDGPMNLEPLMIPISDENIAAFTRMSPNPTDCVINAMEILGILDARSAGIARILVNEKGVSPDDILAIFNLINPNLHQWTVIQHQTSLEELARNLQPGFAYFCGLVFFEVSAGIGGHVVVLAKSADQSVWILDPQLSGEAGITRAGFFLFPLDNYPMANVKEVRVVGRLVPTTSSTW